MTFDEAKVFCTKKISTLKTNTGVGRLAEVRNAEEQELLINTPNFYFSWLNSKKENGIFKWGQQDITYSNFGPGYPRNTLNGCIAISSDGLYWEDIDCTEKRFPICEFTGSLVMPGKVSLGINAVASAFNYGTLPELTCYSTKFIAWKFTAPESSIYSFTHAGTCQEKILYILPINICSSSDINVYLEAGKTITVYISGLRNACTPNTLSLKVTKTASQPTNMPTKPPIQPMPLGNGYQITLVDISAQPIAQPIAPNINQIINKARARWERALLSDLPGTITYPAGKIFCNSYTLPSSLFVDDLVIFYKFETFSSNTELAKTGICDYVIDPTSGQATTRAALMTLNTLCLSSQYIDRLEYIVLHEMGHAVGFGTIWGLYDVLSPADNIYLPYYWKGINGNRGYSEIGGVGSPEVDLIRNHWKESLHKSEIMTSNLGTGPVYFSKMTIRAMQDIGFQVNTSEADVYIHGTRRRLRGVDDKYESDIDLKNAKQVPIYMINYN